MKVIILGAGRVGASVAISLVVEQNEITVVDNNLELLEPLQARYDLRCLEGNATHMSTLRDAGADDADLLIACMNQDEANLVACKIAKQIFNVPQTVARLQSKEFIENPELLGEEGFGVDAFICPEQSVTNYLLSLLEFPEALQVLEFAKGLVTLVAIKARQDSSMVGQPVAQLGKMLPNKDSRIVAIFRNNRPIFPDGDTLIEVNDEVFCLAATEHIRDVITHLHQIDEPIKEVMLGGGGRIGARFASEVDGSIKLKIIEANHERCELLAAELPSRVLILHGDTSDEDLLIEENISDMDLFLAVTNNDENNIMSALMAKRYGARRVIALIDRPVYADLMQDARIDVAISPSQATISELLKHIRRGDVATLHTLRRGTAEVIELIAHGDEKSSRVVGRRIEEIALPGGTVIGALVRGEEVIMAHHDIVIQTDDHVIVLVTNRRLLPKVERLFQLSASFF